MWTPRALKINNVLSKKILLTGGLNESATAIEMRPGELRSCVNYIEVDGQYHGYISASGYERYDGTALASSIDVVYDEDWNVTSDTAREARRTAITKVPGSGEIRGVVLFAGDLYAFRDNTGATACEMYKATTSGWSQITGTSLTAGVTLKFIVERLSDYNTNAETLYFVSGEDDIHAYDGSTITTITTPVTGEYPENLGIWKNRMFLVFDGGHILFSAIGDPTDYSTADVTGEIYLGEDVTDLTIAPGGVLAIFCKNSIQLLYYESTDEDFIFRKEEYSKYSGAFPNTVKRVLGTLIFADDRGVSSLTASQKFGDFSASLINKKVKNTYRSLRGTCVCSVVDRDKNQYILFFNDGDETKALVFTFTIKDDYKRLKGIGTLKYPDKIVCTTEYKTDARSNSIYMGSDDGYIYKYESGTSFDGEEISTNLATSFYDYNVYNRWKIYKRLSLEVNASKGTELIFRVEFNNNNKSFPSPDSTTSSIDNSTYDYGASGTKWGTFIFGTTAVSIIGYRMIGMGTSMSILINSSLKYSSEHTIYNAVVEYNTGAIKL